MLLELNGVGAAFLCEKCGGQVVKVDTGYLCTTCQTIFLTRILQENDVRNSELVKMLADFDASGEVLKSELSLLQSLFHVMQWSQKYYDKLVAICDEYEAELKG